MNLRRLGGALLAGMIVLGWTGPAFCQPVNYGQAISLQKKGDWEGAAAVYAALIPDLLKTHPDSTLLPKSYIGMAYCEVKMGDLALAFKYLLAVWESGAWVNPNLPSSNEFEGYQALLERRYADAMDAFAAAVMDHQPGTKKRQEAEIAYAICHLIVGESAHVRIAQSVLETLRSETGDRRLVAFAKWGEGVSYLILGDVIPAEASFSSAQSEDPSFDPSAVLLDVLVDQLDPPADMRTMVSDTGAELSQAVEDIVRAWYLIAKANVEVKTGHQSEADTLRQEALTLCPNIETLIKMVSGL